MTMMYEDEYDDDEGECECGHDTGERVIVCPHCSKDGLFYGPVLVSTGFKIIVGCYACGWLTDVTFSKQFMRAG